MEKIKRLPGKLIWPTSPDLVYSLAQFTPIISKFLVPLSPVFGPHLNKFDLNKSPSLRKAPSRYTYPDSSIFCHFKPPIDEKSTVTDLGNFIPPGFCILQQRQTGAQ
jgi:hypothetical protein